MIPASLFVAWLGHAGQWQAAVQLRETLAVQLGAAMVMDGKHPGNKRALRALQRAATGAD